MLQQKGCWPSLGQFVHNTVLSTVLRSFPRQIVTSLCLEFREPGSLDNAENTWPLVIRLASGLLCSWLVKDQPILLSVPTLYSSLFGG